MNRNIKISPAADANYGWGCRVLIFGYLEIIEGLLPAFKNGYAKFNGVEMEGCGQYDTTYAGLRIEDVGSDSNFPNEIITEIMSSSIHGCYGFCMFIDDIANVSITNNIFHDGRKFTVYVEDILSDYTFENNVLIGTRKRDEVSFSASGLVDDTAAY